MYHVISAEFEILSAGRTLPLALNPHNIYIFALFAAFEQSKSSYVAIHTLVDHLRRMNFGLSKNAHRLRLATVGSMERLLLKLGCIWLSL